MNSLAITSEESVRGEILEFIDFPLCVQSTKRETTTKVMTILQLQCSLTVIVTNVAKFKVLR